MLDDTEKKTCPECKGDYSHLGIHWARSKDCGYPVPARSDEAVLDGLMFIGGSLNNRQRPDANCYVSIVHKDKEALDWIADQLGALAASVTEWSGENVDYHGGEPVDQLWEFRSRSLPALGKYYSWYNREEDRTVPEDITVRPRLLKTACLLAAKPMEDRPGLYLSLRRSSPPPVAVHRIFGGYGPRIIRSEDGGYVVRIQNSTDLCNDLGPWPGFSRGRFDANQFDEGRISCPQCGGRFRTQTHLCERVEDGSVVRIEDASPGGTREMIEVEEMRARPRLFDGEPARYITWTESDCLAALSDTFETPSEFPSNEEYESQYSGRDDMPSLATLYRRFGSREGWIDELGASIK